MARKVMDCRKMPSVTKCSLTIAGEEEEVLRVAVEHAISVHGHQRSDQLREQIRGGLEDESSYLQRQAGYGAEIPAPH